MGLFRRRRTGRHAADRDVFHRDGGNEDDVEDFIDEIGENGDAEDDEAEPVGPWDEDEAPDDDLERLDLGSLLIPTATGVEIRMEATAEGAVSSVTLVAAEGTLQLGVFAAPKSQGIWDEVRDEVLDSIAKEGGRVEEVDGDYGPELRGRIRTQDGPTNVRIVGIDGPRWFVRAVFQGRAADPAAAQRLLTCLHGLVVVRGKDAMPVREALPLTLPKDMVEQAALERDAPPKADGKPGPGAPRSRGGKSRPRPRRR